MPCAVIAILDGNYMAELTRCIETRQRFLKVRDRFQLLLALLTPFPFFGCSHMTWCLGRLLGKFIFESLSFVRQRM